MFFVRYMFVDTKYKIISIRTKSQYNDAFEGGISLSSAIIKFLQGKIAFEIYNKYSVTTFKPFEDASKYNPEQAQIDSSPNLLLFSATANLYAGRVAMMKSSAIAEPFLEKSLARFESVEKLQSTKILYLEKLQCLLALTSCGIKLTTPHTKKVNNELYVKQGFKDIRTLEEKAALECAVEKVSTLSENNHFDTLERIIEFQDYLFDCLTPRINIHTIGADKNGVSLTTLLNPKKILNELIHEFSDSQKEIFGWINIDELSSVEDRIRLANSIVGLNNRIRTLSQRYNNKADRIILSPEFLSYLKNISKTLSHAYNLSIKKKSKKI